MDYWQLADRSTGKLVVSRLEIADGFWSRLAGLQLRRELPEGAGMLLVPCGSVHTCGMRFPLDVVLLDRAATVVHVARQVRPWRCVLPRGGSYAVLELPAGSCPLAKGDRVVLRPSEASPPLPRTLVRWLEPAD